jgi:WD40 repeat protein
MLPIEGFTGPALLVWQFPLETVLAIASGELGAVTHMVWSADGKTLLVVDDNNRVSIFQPPKAKPVFTQEVDIGTEGRITAVDISSDGDWYLMAAKAIRIRAWRLPFMNAELTAWGTVRRVFFAGDVNEVVTIDATDAAVHWFVNNGNVVADTMEALGDIVTVGVPMAGNMFFGLDSGGHVRGWRSGNLQPLDEVDRPLCAAVEAGRDTLER